MISACGAIIPYGTIANKCLDRIVFRLLTYNIIMVNAMKSQVLQELRRSGTLVSGQALSRKLGISRVSVWKHVNSLKADGYDIAASSQGYRLISSPDLLLPCEFPGLKRKLYHFYQVDSTMNVARRLARQGVEAGTIVVAESQVGGRGRLDRTWISPKEGIYLTIILRPAMSAVHAPRINLMAAVAVARVIRSLFGVMAVLKWPNDVLVGEKKICGILAEMEAEIDAVHYVNVGIGLNVNASVAREEKNATSLKEELGRPVSRKEVLISVLDEIDRQQALLTGDGLLEQWRALNTTLGKDVKIVMLDGEIRGKALDIDTNGALVVKDRKGDLHRILTGDCIHLR
jgi:BirA family biotin operon repressor/biotin-[acetyl-CoA-carboxylase] ligase